MATTIAAALDMKSLPVALLVAPPALCCCVKNSSSRACCTFAVALQRNLSLVSLDPWIPRFDIAAACIYQTDTVVCG